MIRAVVVFLSFCLWIVPGYAIEDSDTEDHWESFKIKYNKQYESEEHENRSRENFVRNLLEIALHNMDEDNKFTKGINGLADKTKEEIKDTLFQHSDVPLQMDPSKMVDFSNETVARAATLDYRSYGVMTPVKDQGDCGSCWSFAAVEALEAQVAWKYNDLVSLSEQQLIDCSKNYGNDGCDGGWPQHAFEYLIASSGAVTEDCYGYAERDQKCRSTSRCEDHYPVSSYAQVSPQGSESALLNALIKKGPLAVIIKCSDNFVDMYSKSGILYDTACAKTRDMHAILLVGYGTLDNQDYWLIRNSWGTGWGEKGYAKMARNWGNMCGIADFACYPIV